MPIRSKDKVTLFNEGNTWQQLSDKLVTLGEDFIAPPPPPLS